MELQILVNELPDSNNEEQFQKWWQENNRLWTDKLCQLMIEYRNIGYDWQFNEQQTQLLDIYICSNVLLMECLGREAVIDRGVRAEIENTLFLPVSD
jgi:predicted NACHT family NTPase